MSFIYLFVKHLNQPQSLLAVEQAIISESAPSAQRCSRQWAGEKNLPALTKGSGRTRTVSINMVLEEQGDETVCRFRGGGVETQREGRYEGAFLKCSVFKESMKLTIIQSLGEKHL